MRESQKYEPCWKFPEAEWAVCCFAKLVNRACGGKHDPLVQKLWSWKEKELWIIRNNVSKNVHQEFITKIYTQCKEMHLTVYCFIVNLNAFPQWNLQCCRTKFPRFLRWIHRLEMIQRVCWYPYEPTLHRFYLRYNMLSMPLRKLSRMTHYSSHLACLSPEADSCSLMILSQLWALKPSEN